MKLSILTSVVLLSLLFLPACFAEVSVITVADEAAPYVTDADFDGILRCEDSTDDIREIRILRVDVTEGWMPEGDVIVADHFWASLAKGESAEFSAMPAVDPSGTALPMEAIEALFEDRPAFTGPDEESECNSREYRLRFYADSDSPDSRCSRVMCYQIDRSLQP